MHTTLISAHELAAHIDDPQWVILDCRHDLADLTAGRAAFDGGHLPHAQFAAIETQLSGLKRGADGQFRGRHPLPERAAFLAVLRSWGIHDDSQVIAYDAQGGMFAARLWWMLRWVGHAATAVLDGGLASWQQAALPLTTAPAEVRAAGQLHERAALVASVTLEEVQANLGTHARVVLDARAADRFRGENETIDAVGGHIPGAKNRFFKDNLQADGRFKAAPALHAEFSKLISTPQATISQCGSGVTACHNLLAMEVAGLSGAALYPGSWSQWCADPGRPVASGA